MLWEEITARSMNFSSKCDLFSRSLACECAFASKLSFRLPFIFECLKTWCSKTNDSIVLSVPELLLFLNQLSNCKSNILNRGQHFMLTTTPSLSPVIGKASECFVRAKRSRIQWKWVVLVWASSRFSTLQVRTCSLIEKWVVISFF